MHIITRATLRNFWETHPEAQAGLRYWYKQVSQAKWQSFQDIRQDFSSADLVGNFIVFNICGNNYRLITYVDFQHEKVFIRKVLTHAEYNKNQWKKDSWFNKY
ncbi:MAG: type II toxin-antitoxin system HigB family toxin [Microcystis aeruginosa BS13-02]|jgi:mRNA interferase HigB|nr:type II toxin-antitoxin system HigB family toxin [Microcystis aeruginosa BS13-02]